MPTLKLKQQQLVPMAMPLRKQKRQQSAFDALLNLFLHTAAILDDIETATQKKARLAAQLDEPEMWALYPHGTPERIAGELKHWHEVATIARLREEFPRMAARLPKLWAAVGEEVQQEFLTVLVRGWYREPLWAEIAADAGLRVLPGWRELLEARRALPLDQVRPEPPF